MLLITSASPRTNTTTTTTTTTNYYYYYCYYYSLLLPRANQQELVAEMALDKATEAAAAHAVVCYSMQYVLVCWGLWLRL